MRVLSLFDGMSCGRYCLSQLNVSVASYIASEVDKYAITVAQKNFPDNVQMGDVRFVRQLADVGALGRVDLLIGGSPCQDLSFAGKQEGFSVDIHTLDEYKRLVAEGFEFKGSSYLFWEYVWIKELVKPRWFLLENVRMKKQYLEVFNRVMGVEGVFINSALVSAQNRQRYYWCNWQVDQPEDRGLVLRDILESGAVDREKSYCIDANYHNGGCFENYKNKARRQIVGIEETPNGLRPYKDDGRKGSLSEIGTIARADNKASTLTVANVPKLTTQSERRLMVSERQSNLIRSENEKAVALTSSSSRCGGNGTTFLEIKGCAERRKSGNFEVRKDEKSNALLSGGHKSRFLQYKQKANTIRVGGNGSPPESRQCWDEITYRKLTVTECERLQGLPDGFTEGVSNTQRYKMLGNGWQCDTITHIFLQGIMRGVLT